MLKLHVSVSWKRDRPACSPRRASSPRRSDRRKFSNQPVPSSPGKKIERYQGVYFTYVTVYLVTLHLYYL
ncbi:hypothetical protein F2P81_026014 [Scophthalmus maximus]|uniref:Uncharacterized protein n=1 Tax=Scophthalmus maximus TaxID=52904 RepID=A0A6A4RIM6_SCOMX|nr:hypothetical protein F2P81_026014 [Scophthalmus maximus]